MAGSKSDTRNFESALVMSYSYLAFWEVKGRELQVLGVPQMHVVFPNQVCLSTDRQLWDFGAGRDSRDHLSVVRDRKPTSKWFCDCAVAAARWQDQNYPEFLIFFPLYQSG